MKKWSLFGIIVVVALSLLVWLGLQQSQADRAVTENSIKHGLMQCYAVASGKSTVITPEKMKDVIQSNLYAPSSDKIRFLPSFVESEDVYYSTSPVTTNSSNIICAIRLRDAAYVALHGNGDCTVLTGDDFQEWPHTQ